MCTCRIAGAFSCSADHSSSTQTSVLLDLLPPEVIVHICSFLEAKFLQRSFSLVCRRFHHILSDVRFWKARLRGRWQKKYPPIPGLYRHRVVQCDFRFDLFSSFSFILVLQYFFVLVLVLQVIFLVLVLFQFYQTC